MAWKKKKIKPLIKKIQSSFLQEYLMKPESLTID